MITARKSIVVGAALLLLAVALLLSCYPGDELTTSETDVVVTLFDPNADFSTKLTYAMPDSVVHLVPAGEDDDISRAYDAAIVSDIAAQMDALGFTRVADPAAADVHMLTAVTVSDYVGYYSYGWYWCYWYGYPPCCWYPYYPAGGVAYSYSIGTIFVMMFDPALVSDTTRPIWTGALNGLADRSTNSQRISSGITQAFKQSQYLGAGKVGTAP